MRSLALTIGNFAEVNHESGQQVKNKYFKLSALFKMGITRLILPMTLRISFQDKHFLGS